MTKPNILILMTDQQRHDCLGLAGHPTVQTPHMDRLASEGTRFLNFYTTSPICMPARSSCHTGLYCHNHGQWTNRASCPDSVPSYAKLLRDAGYRTGHIGKSHLYTHRREHMREHIPFMNRLGFEDVLETTGPWATLSTDSIMTDDWQKKGILDLFRSDYRKRQEIRKQTGREAVWPSPMPEGECLDDFIGRTAVSYFETYDDKKPFCTFVGFGGPHEPWDPSPRWAEHYRDANVPAPLPRQTTPDWLPEPARAYQEALAGRAFDEAEWTAIRRLYYAKISQCDAWIGKIMETLEQRELLKNTLVIFWSDHGERLADRGGLHKCVFYEESVHVPLIIRSPDGVGAGLTVATLAETTDIMPTILQAAGSMPPPALEHPFCRQWKIRPPSGMTPSSAKSIGMTVVPP